jgi:hypothetical protein
VEPDGERGGPAAGYSAHAAPLGSAHADRSAQPAAGDPHPGIGTFHGALSDIRSRPEVADVVLQISEVMEEDDEWPFAEAAYVITTAPPDQVHRWASDLLPDPPDDGSAWLYGDPPPGAPPVPEGHSIVTLYWD